MSFDPSVSTNEDPLDEIVATCLESDPKFLDTAVDRACSDHPDLAGEIRSRIDALRNVGLVRTSTGAGDERFPEFLGEFRLLERLGGGGMGVVFRARQEPLGREVALKVIRPEHLYFPRARERFLRETEAIARLQHESIVPIYTFGEQDGIPHFAMELVPGCTLGEVVSKLRGRAPETLTGTDLEEALLAALPRWASSQSAARWSGFDGSYVTCVVALVLQVADALQHAHERGVLHRDVKPSNVALTPDGRARLFDFGLAGFAERPSQLTASHAEIGSLLYMSPEHLNRERGELDARADVYSLGVTLYELLALQVPYFDPNAELTRRAILDGRPPSLSARNRAVSDELETVCFKAFDRDVAHRYADAAAFARDLRNVLAKRPIEARPPGAALRARRWMQRNPTASVACALGAVIVAGVPTILYVQKAVHANELQVAYDESRRQAENTRSVNDFLVGLFQSPDPQFALGKQVLAKDLLDRAARELGSALGDQPAARANLCDVIAQSYLSLSEYEAAESLMLLALDIREKNGLVETHDSAMAMYGLAMLEQALSRPTALERSARAVEIERKVTQEPTRGLARVLMGHALALARAKEPERARQLFLEALSIQERLPGDERELRQVLLLNLANLLYDAKDYEGAIARQREVLEIARARNVPADPVISAALASIAKALTQLQRFDEAERTFEEALDYERGITGETSERVAAMLTGLAGLISKRGDSDRAQRTFLQALAMFEGLVPRTHAQYQACRERYARFLIKEFRWEEAREQLLQIGENDAQRAIALLEAACRELEQMLGPEDRRTHAAAALLDDLRGRLVK